MNISEPFIQRPVATSLLMAAIGFVGLVAVPFLPVAPLPQVDFPTISVNATLQGASAETMAASVAAPLERQFGQIPGVTQLTSVSALNSTSITIQFELNRNIDSAAQDVQAAITVAGKTLPQRMSTPPSYKKVNPADSPILILAAQSDTLPLITVNDYADNFVAQQISQVPGVAQVDHLRRAASRDPHPGRPGQARLQRPDVGGGAQNARRCNHDCGEGHRQYGANELHHRRQ